MSDYGFELTADESQQYEQNKAAVDAEFEALVKNAQDQRLNESGSLGFSAEDHRGLFTQALSNIAAGNTTTPNTESTQPSMIAPEASKEATKENTRGANNKTTSYTSSHKSAKGK
jgi:hypothetical protein